MKKVCLASIGLFLMICSMFSITAWAASDQPQPYFDYLSSVYAGLYDLGNGIYAIEGSAATPNVGRKVVITVTLEKLNDNNRWEVVSGGTWTGSGMASAHAGGDKSLYPGTYRAHTYAEVSVNGTLIETADAYSQIEFVN